MPSKTRVRRELIGGVVRHVRTDVLYTETLGTRLTIKEVDESQLAEHQEGTDWSFEFPDEVVAEATEWAQATEPDEVCPESGRLI